MKKREYLLGTDLFHSKPRHKAKRKLLNFFFLMLTIFFLRILMRITNGYFLIAAILSFFCIGCPVIILFSSQAILDEKNKVDIQRSHELPIVFDQKKVLFGYIGTLFLFWILPAAVFLLPDKGWLLIGPPIWLFSFAVIMLTAHIWVAFGWRKQTYLRTQVLIIFVLLQIVGSIRMRIF